MSGENDLKRKVISILVELDVISINQVKDKKIFKTEEDEYIEILNKEILSLSN